jgi:hypothetical protein
VSGYSSPDNESSDVGFRVARPGPEPARALLARTGGLVLAGMGRRRPEVTA